MTFGSIEASRQEAIPFLLFQFVYGTGSSDYYAYTTAETAVTYNGATYTPAPISCDVFTAAGSLDNSAIEVRLDKFLPISELFIGYPPSQPITLTVFMGHVGDTNFQLAWPGRVRSAAIDQDHLVLTCEPISTAMRRSGLRRHWQRQCPHCLYSQGSGLCNAVQSAFTVTAAVQAVSSPYLTLPANWQGSTWQQGNFTNGMAKWTDSNGQTQYRSILLIQSSTQICLDGDCSLVTVGTEISLSLGCDRSTDQCSGIFNNINNYGGDPWIPLKNPMGVVNNFT